MGPTLARMARRALDAAGLPRRVIGVVALLLAGTAAGARDSTASRRSAAICSTKPRSRDCPTRRTSIFMAGRKFGSTGNEPLTWAMNAHLPALVSPTISAAAGSSRSRPGTSTASRQAAAADRARTTSLRRSGEYAMSCLGRERMFEYFSRAHRHTRRDPAAELRDRDAVRGARRSGAARAPGRADRRDDGLLQRDLAGGRERHGPGSAGARVDAAARSSNIAGPEELSVRAACTELARLLGVEVSFTGQEAGDALLSNGARGWERLGAPASTRPA